MKKISFTKLVALFWLQLQHTRYKMLYNIRMKNKNLHFIEQRSTLLHADMLSNAKDRTSSFQCSEPFLCLYSYSFLAEIH